MPTNVGPVLNLARSEGLELFSAGEAILKGCLESEAAIHHVLAPWSGWGGERGDRQSSIAAMLRLATEDTVARLLASHGCTVEAVPDGPRALAVAMQSARSGRRALALIPNLMLDASVPMLDQFSRGRLDGEGAVCVLLEDRPGSPGASCPRRIAMRLNWPCLEAVDLSTLRDMIEFAMRISRAGSGATASPAAIVVHESILRQIDTLECRPNRVADRMDLAHYLRRRRRAVRAGESGDVLRQARRYELNRQSSPPSRGERVPAGFIVSGPCAMALKHLFHDLKLGGRIPVLRLGLIHPIDESVLARFLERVRHAIVLEPRPGSIGQSILSAAETMRRRGESPGTVWWRSIPRNESESTSEESLIEPGDALNPSILARKGLPLFHAIRPAEKISGRLSRIDADLSALHLPPRSSMFGADAMLRDIRHRLESVDQQLREQTATEESDIPPSVLAIDGIQPEGPRVRVVQVELFTRRTFVHVGPSTIRHVAVTGRPAIIIVADQGDDDHPDTERLVRAVIPAEGDRRSRGRSSGGVGQVVVRIANLGSGTELEEALNEAALLESVTVLIVRDGGETPHDPAALEAEFVEVDRLGFQPRQRLILPADYGVEFGPAAMTSGAELARTARREALPARSDVSVEKISRSIWTPWRLRVRPLLEQIEVVRTRPPAPWRRLDLSTRLPVPKPEHASAGVWRVHIAGWRGPAPGAAAMLIADAGRSMGYHVRCITEPSPIAPGRRAWNQILFTRQAIAAQASARSAEWGPPSNIQIPWGEADLVLGVDILESIRALGPDQDLRVADPARTFGIINDAPLDDQHDDEFARLASSALRLAAPRAMRPGTLVDPFASICRSYFFTDRLTDLVMIGVAFQKGFIPVSIEAIEAAARRLEARGFGRSLEALQIGRRLAIGDLKLDQGDRDEPVERLVRRMVLSISRGSWPDRNEAVGFEHLVRSALSKLIAAGRGARTPEIERELVMAFYRASMWGGLAYATQMAEVLVPLLDDGGTGTGVALLRLALPAIAESMLIRDLFYLSTTAMSLEHRRRMRERLSVRLPRGDQIERRYFNRLEARGFGHRIRIEFRSSDWPARITALVARLIPIRWRGSRRDREVRSLVLGCIQSAAAAQPDDRGAWAESLARLHVLARSGRLRSETPESIVREAAFPGTDNAIPASLRP